MLLCLGAMACTKIEDLSTDTSLKSLVVLAHSPESIILGDVNITADTVYLPIKYGKYEFPLTLLVEAIGAEGTYIYGLSKNEAVTFDSINAAPLRFVVSAENGRSKNYYIAPYEVPLGESTELMSYVSFASGELDNLLLSNTLMDEEGATNTKTILAIATTYPLNLTPEFTVAETSEIEYYREQGSDEWLSFANGATELSYGDSSTVYEFYITAESGKTAVWQVGASIIDYSTIDITTQINYKDLSATFTDANLELKGFDIDFSTGAVTVLIESLSDEALAFPLDITLDVPVNEWLSLIGISSLVSHTFNSIDDTFSFAVLYAEKFKATSWSVGIEQYEPVMEQVLIDSAEIADFSCGTYKFIFTYDNLTPSTTMTTPMVYANSREIQLFYSSYYEPLLSSTSLSSWWAEYELNLTLSNGEQSVETLRWAAEANSSGKITQTEIQAAVASVQYIDVLQPDSTFETWSVSLVEDNITLSSECSLLDLTINNTTPNYVTFKDPAYTLDEGAQTVYLNIGTYYNFPMSIDFTYEISDYASVEPSTLNFESDLSVDTVRVRAQDGVTMKNYAIKLIVPADEVAPMIRSVEFGALVDGVSYVGEPYIDSLNNTILIGIEATNNDFPLTVPIQNVIVGDGGVFDMPSSNSLVFGSASSSATAWVSSADGSARALWNFEIYYYQQIAGGDMNSWEWDASPVTSSLPWSTPNMSGIAAVENTTPVTGMSGESGDYAAQMKTGTSWGQLASGSIFTGWFDKDNSTSYGLSDPVRLTFFGTPFAPDAKVVGLKADVSYAQASGTTDWGSLTVILIEEGSSDSFVFHGNKPNDYDDPTQGSAPHSLNTATEVASERMIFGNGSATATSYGDTIDKNVTSGEWTSVYIPITTDKPFSHISVAAASSAYGDYFIGQSGSVMRLDNVVIVYETKD